MEHWQLAYLDKRRLTTVNSVGQRGGHAVLGVPNASVGDRYRARWRQVRHREYQKFSVAGMLEHEQPH